MMELEDKVVLITGAGKGTGAALALAFAAQGALVAANDISPLNVESVVADIIANGGRAKAYVDDIAKKVTVQAIVKDVEDDFGRIDILVNHAAVEPNALLLEMDEWDWQRTLNVNLGGAFLVTQSVARGMRERGGGVIIHLISDARSKHGEARAAYLASMAGLRGFSQQAAKELAPYGIRVHAVGIDVDDPVTRVLDLCLKQP
jgi:NAD(P)-dependent dehydrogenase (short-subunit alcohol dehydrogenase family)